MRILVLESSATTRHFIKDELEGGDYEILAAESPAEVRRILRAEPDIALLTLGTALAGGDGFDFLAEITAPGFQAEIAPLGNDAMRVVFVTSNDNDADRLRGYHLGAADFIQKPWPRGDLLAHVNSVLGCGTEMRDLSVLVVDDSRASRHFVKACLNRLGVQVHEADDGETAWSFLRENRVDLVLTDLVMARMGGDELCLKIRSTPEFRDLPVIFLSANEDRAATLALFKLGATDYLAKPCILEELLARIRVHLERELLVRSLRGVPATAD